MTHRTTPLAVFSRRRAKLSLRWDEDCSWVNSLPLRGGGRESNLGCSLAPREPSLAAWGLVFVLVFRAQSALTGASLVSSDLGFKGSEIGLELACVGWEAKLPSELKLS